MNQTQLIRARAALDQNWQSGVDAVRNDPELARHWVEVAALGIDEPEVLQEFLKCCKPGVVSALSTLIYVALQEALVRAGERAMGK